MAWIHKEIAALVGLAVTAFAAPAFAQGDEKNRAVEAVAGAWWKAAQDAETRKALAMMKYPGGEYYERILIERLENWPDRDLVVISSDIEGPAALVFVVDRPDAKNVNIREIHLVLDKNKWKVLSTMTSWKPDRIAMIPGAEDGFRKLDQRKEENKEAAMRRFVATRKQ